MKIDLTIKEAKHLLEYNTGFQSCPIFDDEDNHAEHNCPYRKSAEEKIKLAIKNEETNNL